MTLIHASTAERWHTFTICEQLGNAGSEFERAVSAKSSGKISRFDNALSRFLELMDLTASDPRWGEGRKREILRLREMSCGILCDTSAASAGLPAYQADFLRYGTRARPPA